ncbi:hypothetical protein N7505_007593 [Penicillium chrysogenum]|uniref:BZIP domain-containing protein n=1 Tax=Penicillium chrysogenum TaxID=5076 RepID=A0ABQ8WDV9_PENCH|nr:hypothetical protein N7505_007593 [Penicillium chrysogenum]
MAAEQKTIRTRHSNSLKSIRQKQARRRNSLLRKSFRVLSGMRCRRLHDDTAQAQRADSVFQLLCAMASITRAAFSSSSLTDAGLALPNAARDNMARYGYRIRRWRGSVRW